MMVVCWKQTLVFCILLISTSSLGSRDTGACPESPRVKDKADLDREIRSVILAKTAHDCASADKALFETLDSKKVRSLKFHENDSLSLRAAWIEVRIALPKDEQRRLTRPKSNALYRFLGFAEGRLRVTLPSWWEECILQVSGYDQSQAWFPAPSRKQYRNTAFGLQGLHGTTLLEQKGGILLKHGDYQVLVPTGAFRQILEDARSTCIGEYVSVCFSSSRCYLAIHGDYALQYSLNSIDRNSGKVLWKSPVWAGGGTLMPQGGEGHHRVQILVDGDRVVVFGVALDTAYIEVFRTNDGSSLCRFSTSY
jgi:hypothetical protein